MAFLAPSQCKTLRALVSTLASTTTLGPALGKKPRSRPFSNFATGYSLPRPKPLSDIIQMDKMLATPPGELEQMWNDYHIGRGHIGSTMASSLYPTLLARAKLCPSFVIPVVRGNGFVSMYLQAQMPHLLFTSVEDFKVRRTEASPIFCVTHYDDLSSSKGMVLIRGDVVLPSKLSDPEALSLLKRTQECYLSDSLYRHVKAFNHNSSEFDFRALLRDLRVGLA